MYKVMLCLLLQAVHDVAQVVSSLLQWEPANVAVASSSR